MQHWAGTMLGKVVLTADPWAQAWTMQVHLYAGFFSHLTGTIVLREPWLAQSLDAEPQDREEGQLTIKLYITLDLFFFFAVWGLMPLTPPCSRVNCTIFLLLICYNQWVKLESALNYNARQYLHCETTVKHYEEYHILTLNKTEFKIKHYLHYHM